MLPANLYKFFNAKIEIFVTYYSGRKWFRLFQLRHPDLSIRKSQILNPGRAAKLNRAVVGDYFEKLRNTLLDLGIGSNPFNIYNMDEKGCRLMVHKNQSVLAEKGLLNCYR